MSMFLTPDELKDLTGYAYKGKQAEWLGRRGWKFECDAQNRPKVLRTYAEAKMGANTRRATQAEPNFAALLK